MTPKFHEETLPKTTEAGHDLPVKSTGGAAFALSDWESGFFYRLDMIERSRAVLSIDDLGGRELSARRPKNEEHLGGGTEGVVLGWRHRLHNPESKTPVRKPPSSLQIRSATFLGVPLTPLAQSGILRGS